MANRDIYKDIAKRSNGNIYIGVVGPVRTGKSTFIARFMENLVIPNLADGKKSVAVDEMPQSATGRTIMTTEPKFVPADGAVVAVGNATAKVRLVDCVGYMVDGATGLTENDKPRLVKTPWQKEPMPFEQAAEYGTDKVVGEHSTIAVVVTTDGSFTDIPRAAYIPAEDKVISKLKSVNKPFIVLFNCMEPTSKAARSECEKIEEKHGVKTIAVNVDKLDKNGLSGILSEILYEFPLKKLSISLPDFLVGLSAKSKIIGEILEKTREAGEKLDTMRSVAALEQAFDGFEGINIEQTALDMASGEAEIKFGADESLFYRVISDETGESVENRSDLLKFLRGVYGAGVSYERLRGGVESSLKEGYGVVAPELKAVKTAEPRLVKKSGGSYSVKIRAEGDSMHIIGAKVCVDVDVVTGSKSQCEAFLNQLSESEDFMQTEVFGRPLYSLIGGELNAKCLSLNENLKGRVRRILTKAVNEGKNNLICILI